MFYLTLTIKGSNAKVRIYCNHIAAILEAAHGAVVYTTGTDNEFTVNESYETILELLANSRP